jgi:hypothetical protein
LSISILNPNGLGSCWDVDENTPFEERSENMPYEEKEVFMRELLKEIFTRLWKRLKKSRKKDLKKKTSALKKCSKIP